MAGRPAGAPAGQVYRSTHFVRVHADNDKVQMGCTRLLGEWRMAVSSPTSPRLAIAQLCGAALDSPHCVCVISQTFPLVTRARDPEMN